MDYTAALPSGLLLMPCNEKLCVSLFAMPRLIHSLCPMPPDVFSLHYLVSCFILSTVWWNSSECCTFSSSTISCGWQSVTRDESVVATCEREPPSMSALSSSLLHNTQGILKTLQISGLPTVPQKKKRRCSEWKGFYFHKNKLAPHWNRVMQILCVYFVYSCILYLFALCLKGNDGNKATE